jgi:hypothetical protein
MSVKVEATTRIIPVVEGVTITLDQADARILRMLLGGTHREERRTAVKRNGGTVEDQDRGRFLVKEIIDAIDAKALGLFKRPEPLGADNSDETSEYDAEDAYDIDIEESGS